MNTISAPTNTTFNLAILNENNNPNVVATASDAYLENFKGKSWEQLLETRKKKRSSKSHSDRIQDVSEYLYHRAVVGCIHFNIHTKLSCNCLYFLNTDDVGRKAAANFVVGFCQDHRSGRQSVVMERSRCAAKVINNVLRTNEGLGRKCYPLPFESELEGQLVADQLNDALVCKSSLMEILLTKKTFWRTCETAVKNDSMPTHGNKGKDPPNSKIFKHRWCQPWRFSLTTRC
jgi:hypothetical protein